MSTEEIFERWVKIFDSIAAEDITFQLKFRVPKAFGKPGAIIVRNNHPNEFLLKNFTLDVPDQTEFHFYTNSWVYNTENGEGRIFFRSTVRSRADSVLAVCGYVLFMLGHVWLCMSHDFIGCSA